LEDLGLPLVPMMPEWDTQEGMETLNPLSEPCPEGYLEGDEPDADEIQYKLFRRTQTGPYIPLYMAEWDPLLNQGTDAPALVLFPGGGWRASCRRLLQQEAKAFAADGYIVFSADYRLSCIPSDNPSADELPLCGWQWPATDLESPGGHGAAMHDVQD